MRDPKPMFHFLLIGAASIATLLLTGCASVINGQNQSVSVNTVSKGSDVSGATCSLRNDKGVWYVTSPGSVAIHRSYGELAVSCTHAGLPDGLAAVKSSTTGAVFGNILVGGVIGAGIDVATGAAYSYPNVIPIEMGRTNLIDSATPARADAQPGRPTTPVSPMRAAARVPYLNDAQQAEYQRFLTKPFPRAFAIAPTGHYVYNYSTSPLDKSHPNDPSERALMLCSRLSGVGCELYAVDDQVVFKALPQQPQPQPAGVRSRRGNHPVDPALAAVNVPLLNEGQQAEYQVFLTRSLPRAFAISGTGHFAMAWSTTPLDKSQPSNPSMRALSSCRLMSGHDCQLYLVDNEIVYKSP